MQCEHTGDTGMSFHHFTKEKHSTHQLILDQIESAFQTTPNIASTLHGQRKIYQGCYGRRTSLFPSTKCGGAIPLESRLELAHAICLERDPTVKNFRTQAIKIPLSKTEHCYPDFLIQTIDNQYEIHEIKPNIKSLSEQELDRFDKVSMLLNHIGVTFKLVDQSCLPPQKQLQQLLYWYQRGHARNWSPFEIDLATETLEQKTFKSIEQIFVVLQNEDLDIRIGDYLLFHGVISLSPLERIYNKGVA
jgi:hypothetical protein